jgi:hypothetical protein
VAATCSGSVFPSGGAAAERVEERRGGPGRASIFRDAVDEKVLRVISAGSRVQTRSISFKGAVQILEAFQPLIVLHQNRV